MEIRQYTFEDLQNMMAELIISQKETEKMFKETDVKFKETDLKFQVTDKQIQETKEMIKNISLELGGIGKSNGQMAEDFFFSALENKMALGKLKFDFIDRNLKRKRNKTEAEFDMIMYNAYKVLIVEVKYKFTLYQLREFYEKRIKKFRILFPEYKDYKLFGCIAGLVIEKEVKEEAENYGFMIITQNNQNIEIINRNDFEPVSFH